MSRGNRISLLESIKRRDPHLAGIKRKISQRESQKLDFIIKVLDYALKHETFNVSELQQKLKISRNSIDKTILLLKEKKLVKLYSRGLKNKKFYKIKSKIRVKKYRTDLHKWKMFKISLKTIFTPNTLQQFDKYQRIVVRVNRQIQKNTKKNKFKARNISKLGKTPLYLKKEYQKQITDVPYPEPVFLKSINSRDAFKIIKKYNNYRYCDICLEYGKLVDLIDVSDYETACKEFGHVTQL